MVPNFFLLFSMKLCILIDLKVLISNMTIIFSNFGLKESKKDILGLKLKVFLHESLCFDKFEGVDFKYGNSFFQILVQKYPFVINLTWNFVFFRFWSKSAQIRHFLSQTPSLFLFFMMGKIQLWQYSFTNFTQKKPK